MREGERYNIHTHTHAQKDARGVCCRLENTHSHRGYHMTLHAHTHLCQKAVLSPVTHTHTHTHTHGTDHTTPHMVCCHSCHTQRGVETCEPVLSPVAMAMWRQKPCVCVVCVCVRESTWAGWKPGTKREIKPSSFSFICGPKWPSLPRRSDTHMYTHTHTHTHSKYQVNAGMWHRSGVLVSDVVSDAGPLYCCGWSRMVDRTSWQL